MGNTTPGQAYAGRGADARAAVRRLVRQRYGPRRIVRADGRRHRAGARRTRSRRPDPTAADLVRRRHRRAHRTVRRDAGELGRQDRQPSRRRGRPRAGRPRRACCCRRTGRPRRCCWAAGRPASRWSTARCRRTCVFAAAGPGRRGQAVAGERYGPRAAPVRAAACPQAPAGWRTTTSRYGRTATTSRRRTPCVRCERRPATAVQPGDRVLVDAAAHPDPRCWLARDRSSPAPASCSAGTSTRSLLARPDRRPSRSPRRG